MTNEELDRILSAEDRIEPSSAFATKVMSEVWREAREVRTPFPWLWFLLGVVASLVMAGAGAEVAAASSDMSLELSCAVAAVVVALGLVSGWRIRKRATDARG